MAEAEATQWFDSLNSNQTNARTGMIPSEKLRKTEVQQPDGSWLEVQFSQLEPGDIMRQFEPDGSPVTWLGSPLFVVRSFASVETDSHKAQGSVTENQASKLSVDQAQP